jgi:leucyl aminopeptidase
VCSIRVAAAFLQRFVEKGVKWAHVDIAGPAMFSKARGEFPAGGTGFGARLGAALVTGSYTQ